ncbi:MAG: sugar ABC transporter permease, partial [Bifidobacteriaceae bacterium]|jgi:N-acetylglucosamine transport system permease protein|nr:sugar ABC transporter permease [Bifidobacteriaceae bacterium]
MTRLDHAAAARPPRRAARRRRRPTFDRASFMAVFLALPLSIFAVFVVVPYAQSFYYALTDWRGFSDEMGFVGLQNFGAVFADPVFLASLRNSVTLGAVLPTCILAAAFAIAFVVTSGGPAVGRVRGLAGSGLYRVVSFFPYAVPAVVIGLIWVQVFDPSRGLLNGLLVGLGLDRFESFAWLGDTRTAMPAAMFTIAWGLVGFYTVLFVAAIKSVPAETYEAARIDGAGRWRTAVQVALPQVLGNVRTAYIYLGLMVIDAFGYMMVLNPNGGPNHATLTMTQELYATAFRAGRFGLATAMGLVLAAVTLAYALIVFAVFRLVAGPGERRRSS